MTCVACGCPTPDRACSYACIDAVGRERDGNVAILHRLSGHPTTAAHRADLVRRNGEILAALLAWRPHVSPSGGRRA
jgi:hypothetical protein